jgi:RNA polymerase sigma factor (sigma-70 family)
MKVIGNRSENDAWNKFIRDGNLDALSRIYFDFYDQLFSYGLKHTSDKQAVEDSIQNVFLNLIKFRKNIGEVKNLTGYLLISFRRQLFSGEGKNKQTIITDVVPEEKFDYYKCHDHEILDKEDLETVLNAIEVCMDKLGSRQREIVYLKFQTGISYEEIAQMLDISVDSCYKSIYRSVKFIREELEKILGKGNHLIF